ncbi:GMP synthase subunit A [Methanobacterium alcaliphilum]|uniref:GMP synthase subunit A n=1 Tax=Methanobacterium alcaliphilum TaxID=392018 RepID=UPI00200A9A0E|nr:GMP synthase subunit A [Methanobacterium alcaliphilum]MCK9152098.1 GMP synthase subunit A [Methanobacterium alcaliphilum]
MKILVVNNHGQYNHRIHRTLHYLKIPSELVSNELSLEEIKSKDPIGIVLGGGPSIERSGNSIEYIKNLELPILGICLGHQLIGKAFGGEISTADAQSYAQIELEIITENDIFQGLGPKMNVWASHKDEVKQMPSDFDVLAKSDICSVEAMKHQQKPIYGIQFHPEVHHTENGPLVFENFYEACKRYSKSIE